MVVWQSHTSELELLWRLDCMSVVVAQDSLAIGLMQSKRVSNTMRNTRINCYPSGFYLYPIAITLINDLIMEF